MLLSWGNGRCVDSREYQNVYIHSSAFKTEAEGSEQQRLAFARIVISSPKLVVLDESSSALYLDNEVDMYRLIGEMGATCISVGKRPTVLEFHDQVHRIQANGKWEVETPERTRESLNQSLHG